MPLGFGGDTDLAYVLSIGLYSIENVPDFLWRTSPDCFLLDLNEKSSSNMCG